MSIVVVIKCKLQTMQTAQTVYTVHFFFFLIILHVITLLVTLELFPIFGHHMTKFYKVISSNLISNFIAMPAQCV